MLLTLKQETHIKAKTIAPREIAWKSKYARSFESLEEWLTNTYST